MHFSNCRQLNCFCCWVALWEPIQNKSSTLTKKASSAIHSNEKDKKRRATPHCSRKSLKHQHVKGPGPSGFRLLQPIREQSRKRLLQGICDGSHNVGLCPNARFWQHHLQKSSHYICWLTFLTNINHSFFLCKFTRVSVSAYWATSDSHLINSKSTSTQ